MMTSFQPGKNDCVKMTVLPAVRAGGDVASSLAVELLVLPCQTMSQVWGTGASSLLISL